MYVRACVPAHLPACFCNILVHRQKKSYVTDHRPEELMKDDVRAVAFETAAQSTHKQKTLKSIAPHSLITKKNYDSLQNKTGF